ncbi:MAG: DUF748 domain-containing protein [Burkholderiaceae bacterium]|jgi:hypothetical protein|nr:DUF748 domain-containing protein [Burkholderiaceae bacterium]
MTRISSLRTNKWIRRAAIVLCVFLALWLLTWLAMPPLLRAGLEKFASQTLGRQVTVERVDFKPGSLELTLDNLRIAAASPTQPPQFELGRLYINAAFESLVQRAPVIDALRIEHPMVRVRRIKGGGFDFDDILARLASPPEQPKPQSPLPRFAVYNIAVTGGGADFVDEDLPKPQVQRLRDLTLGVPFLNSLPSHRTLTVKPKLAFTLNGSHFGSGVQSTPFTSDRKTAGQVKFQRLDLSRFLSYLPPDLPIRPQAGILSADLNFAFEHGTQADHLRISGTVGLHQVRINDAQGRQTLAWDGLTLNLADVQPFGGRVHLSEFRLDTPRINVARAANGQINVIPPAAHTASPPSSTSPQKQKTASDKKAAPGKSSPWKIQVDRFVLHAAKIDWNDAMLAPPAAFTLGPFELDAGNFSWASDTDRVALERLQLDSLALAQGTTLLNRIGHITLQNTDIDLTEHKVALGALAIADPKLLVDRDRRGQWMFQRWLPPTPSKPAGKKTKSAGKKTPAAAQASSKPWSITLASATLQGGAVSYSDASTPKTAAFEISDLALKAQNIALDKLNARWPLEFSGRLAARTRAETQTSPQKTSREESANPGYFEYKGVLAIDPLAVQGNLNLRALPIHAFRPYLSTRLPNINLQRALFSYKGQAGFGLDKTGMRVHLAGDTSLDDLRINSALAGNAGVSGRLDPRQRRLLNWKTLSLRGVSLKLSPTQPIRFDVKQTTLTDFFARLLIDPSGHLQLRNYTQSTPIAPDARPEDTESTADAEKKTAPPKTASATATATATATADKTSTDTAQAASPSTPGPSSSTPSSKTADAAPVIHFGPIVLVNGVIDFTDHFIKPNYSANLSKLTGKLSAFSTTPRNGQPQLGELELHGNIQQTGTLKVSGKLNPLVKPIELNIDAKVRDIELAPLSPYSGHYVGYGIERGKLNADVNYKVTPDGQLTATNQIMLDQLKFGDQAQAGALRTLPVKLAVALLADREGVIKVELPVSGSINDPQFKIGALVWKALLNIIAKAATAPFNLLINGFSGGSQGSAIAFAPGSATLSADQRANLDKAAQALLERTALKLTIIGTADLERERDAYQREHLRQLVQAEHLRRARTSQGAKKTSDKTDDKTDDEAAVDAAPLNDAEYSVALRAIYKRADISKPRNFIGIAKDISQADMEKLLMTSISVDQDTIRKLASTRAAVVRDELLAHKVPPERIFLGAEQIQASNTDWKPEVQLKLDTR